MLQKVDLLAASRCNMFSYALILYQVIAIGSLKKLDPMSTMQKTGWTIHSPFLVLFGVKKNFTVDVITRGQATTIIGPFSARKHSGIKNIQGTA